MGYVKRFSRCRLERIPTSQLALAASSEEREFLEDGAGGCRTRGEPTVVWTMVVWRVQHALRRCPLCLANAEKWILQQL